MDDTSNPIVVAYGQFRLGGRIKLAVAANEARTDMRFVEDPAELEALLDVEPVAVVMDMTAMLLEEAYQVVRTHENGRSIPVIAVATELDDLVFAETFAAGGDDAVELDAVRPLLLRLRFARNLQRLPEPEPRGIALIADPDKDRRVVRARVLQGAGFVVQFAGTASEAIEQMGAGTVKLFIAEADLEGGQKALLQSARTHVGATHVLLSRPQGLVAATAAIGGLQNVAVVDAYAPAESIIFTVNELQGPRMADRRRTRRVLYGTKVAFRGEGRERADFGFNYNISEEGLYVRTLAPPEDEIVWLELRPPRSNRWVHLEARVAWRRAFGHAGAATVPPGFGVELRDATPSNMSTWMEGYMALLEGLHGPPFANEDG